MLEEQQTTAAVTITTTVDATNLVNLRRQFKAVLRTDETPPIGYTEIVVKLTALALEKHPMLKSSLEGRSDPGLATASTSESPSTPRPA